MEEIPEEAHQAVMGPLALMNLTMAFKERYGEETFDILTSFMVNMGEKRGEELKRKQGITGGSIEDIKRMFESFITPLGTGEPPKITTEGNKMIVERGPQATCPMILISRMTGVPLKDVCSRLAVPQAKGMFKTLNPTVKHTFSEISENCCKEIWEID